MENHIKQIKSLIGADRVLTSDDNIEGYEIGWRGDIGKALCVARPKSTEGVSKIVSYCAKNNIHIIPQSGNTGMVDNSTPDPSGTQILINLESLNDIIEIDTVNKCTHLGAGVRLSNINSTLDSYGLQIPIDLGSDPCIGGMVSTNTGGSRFLKYRGMRDHVMGLKIVLADEHGTIIDLIRPLHKDNSGLDLKQIFVGTGGLFGIVTEAVIRLSPKQEQSATALLVPSTPEAVNTLLIEIERSCGTYLSAFEGMSRNAMHAAFNHNPSLLSPFGQDSIPDYAILLELSRSWPARDGEQSLDHVLENVLSELWEREDAPLENALIGAPEKLWQMRHSISEGVQKSGKLYAFDISLKRSDIVEFRKTVSAEIQTTYPEITICDFGHIGDGAMHFALILPADDPRTQNKDFDTEIREWLNDRVVLNFNGSYSAEHGLGRKTQDAYNKYTPEDVKQITRAIKKAIAPAAISTIQV